MSAQQNKKTRLQQLATAASYNTYYIVPDLIDFLGNDWKEIKTQTEKRNIHDCEKYCTD